MARSILKYCFNRKNSANGKNNYIFFDHNKLQNKIDCTLTICRPEIANDPSILLKAETLSEYKLPEPNATISKDRNDLQKKESSKTKRNKQKSVSRDFKFLKKQSITQSNRVDDITLWSRGYTIINEDIGKRFKIHNGQTFISRKVVENMVSHKFGEFSLTKKKTIHKDNKRKQIKKKK